MSRMQPGLSGEGNRPRRFGFLFAAMLQAARGGSSVAAIATKLNLSNGTVRNHPSAVIGKTQAANRAEAVLLAELHGWL